MTTTPPPGFVLFGQQVQIAAPPATPADPLVIVFQIDASRIPAGEDEGTVAVLKDGAFVANCAGPPGIASPDACVSMRERLADLDVRLTVLTSSASAWNFGLYRLELPTELLVSLRSDLFGTDLIRVVFPAWRYRFLVNLVSDADNDRRDEMRGAMLPFEMSGQSQQLGLVIVRLRSVQKPPFQPSAVWIEETSNQFPGLLEVVPFGPHGRGQITHQLFFEFELVDLERTLHNVVPLELRGDITQWPPAIGEDWKLSKGPVPLFDQGNPSRIEVTAASARTAIRVSIDVKPGTNDTIWSPNTGIVPVAVLSTSQFDATASIDPVSLGFGKTGEENSLVRQGRARVPACSSVDVNHDGLLDVVCRFRGSKTGLQPGDSEAALRGRTLEGLVIAGFAPISTAR